MAFNRVESGEISQTASPFFILFPSVISVLHNHCVDIPNANKIHDIIYPLQANIVAFQGI